MWFVDRLSKQNINYRCVFQIKFLYIYINLLDVAVMNIKWLRKMGWARVGWERLQSSFFFGIQMNCSFREKIGKRTQWISRSVFVKMWIFWFCQSIFMFPLYCLGRLKPQQMPTVITLVPGMTISQLLALQLPPHVLIHKCAMSNFNFSLYFSMIHNCKIFL